MIDRIKQIYADKFNAGSIYKHRLKKIRFNPPKSVSSAFPSSLYICKMQQAKDDLQVRWLKLRIMLKEKHGIKPDMDGVLFLIGVQELGTGKQEYTKEQKQDLMHIAICTVLAPSGYYALSGYDEEGWPHFTQLKALPEFNLYEQENFLKDHVLLYFEQFSKPIIDL